MLSGFRRLKAVVVAVVIGAMVIGINTRAYSTLVADNLDAEFRSESPLRLKYPVILNNSPNEEVCFFGCNIGPQSRWDRVGTKLSTCAGPNIWPITFPEISGVCEIRWNIFQIDVRAVEVCLNSFGRSFSNIQYFRHESPSNSNFKFTDPRPYWQACEFGEDDIRPIYSCDGLVVCGQSVLGGISGIFGGLCCLRRNFKGSLKLLPIQSPLLSVSNPLAFVSLPLNSRLLPQFLGRYPKPPSEDGQDDSRDSDNRTVVVVEEPSAFEERVNRHIISGAIFSGGLFLFAILDGFRNKR
jgi:hypothetical protein